MIGHRSSRGGAVLVALAIQGLILLALGVGLGMFARPERDSPAMAVTLVPDPPPPVLPPASRLQLHVHLRDPGVPPPVVPVDLVLMPAVAEPTSHPIAIDRTVPTDSAGAVSVDSQIGIISRVEPDYPLSAAQRHAQGTTLLAIRVDANGHPGAVRVMRSSGDVQLDTAAVRAVQKWVFTAATANSQVVPAWARLEVNFNLTLYQQEHPRTSRTRNQDERDPTAALAAVIKSWSERGGLRVNELRNQHGLELLTPEVRRVLQKFGNVRNIRLMGVSARPPQGVAQNEAQSLRQFDSDHVQGWDVFEVTHLHGTSQWYCAVDEAGEIQVILIDGS